MLLGLLNKAAKSTISWTKAEAIEGKTAAIEVFWFVRRHDWIRTAKIVFRRKYWVWWITLAVTIALSTVLSSYHTQIIRAISPYRKVIRHAQWSFLVPLIVLIIVSFPPLFGHELIILAVGVIYGLGVGFAIACAGTFLGEIACFYAFRYWFTNRAQKIEAKHVAYSCLARMMREGGVKIIILVRFSAVPGHITTAIQSTIGMSVWIYSIAAVVSLPKQFALVYLGVVFGQTAGTIEEWQVDHPNSDLADYYSGDSTLAQRHRISLIVFAVTTIATLFAGYIVWMRVRKIRPAVVQEMAEKARLQAIRDGAGLEGDKDGEVTPTFLRPAFLPLNSTISGSSQIGLLDSTVSTPYGRSRAGTINSAERATSLYSPSMPHLPYSRDDDVDYFTLETMDSRGGSAQNRRGSF